MYFTTGRTVPTAFQARSPDVVVENAVDLTRSLRTVLYSRLLDNRATASEVKSKEPPGDRALTAASNSQEFLASVKVGSQTFKFIVDTGDSDTWLAWSGFECINIITGRTRPEAECAFGKLYSPSSSFSQIANENFNITYASCGKAMEFQVGLAFPANTSAFQGTNPALDGSSTQVIYKPLFTNLFAEGEVAPAFSLPITRSQSGGQLGIGGIPNVTHSGSLVIAPFQVLTLETESAPSDGSKTSQFYSINVQGFQIANHQFSGYSSGYGYPTYLWRHHLRNNFLHQRCRHDNR
ncbi:MAG: hypothetical protein MMC33_008439 [Icmadophila ericetorum]|nr:hypothetical protein [Icmadophila ericetorum]